MAPRSSPIPTASCTRWARATRSRPQRLKADPRGHRGLGPRRALAIREAPRGHARAARARARARARGPRSSTRRPDRGYAYLDPDTSMNPQSLSAALRAAGAVVEATDLVMAGEAQHAFCAVRPPGHHATPRAAHGLLHLQQRGGRRACTRSRRTALERVAILDFDVHHGNGTEDAFHEDPRVMLCSTFQHPYYPVLRRRFRQRPHHERAAAGDDRRSAGSAHAVERSGCRRSSASGRSWCSSRPASTRTATTRSPTSSSTTRTTAG